MEIKSFLAELRRRHVFRVAAWYAVAAWLVIQIATNTFPHLMFPDWTVRFVIILCLIGFPVAIALAWALEVTPEGVRVTSHARPEPVQPIGSSWRSRSLWLALAGGILLGAAALHAWRALSPHTAVDSSPKVLAVLPFENLGGDEDNAAFTAGIHDTLITRIAKIGGMTVISRTSVMAYEGKRPNLRDVAKSLGVTHVVEGSVQRSGDQVRIQAQLIDAGTDTHLWAESFDRALSEGFAMQSEIASSIARELSVQLTEKEHIAFRNIPTRNADAYEQYVLGHAEMIRRGEPKAMTSAISHFNAAVHSDPEFALAFAELSIAQAAHAYFNSVSLEQQFEEIVVAARENYEQALALQSEMAEGILARGVFHYYLLQDYRAAEPDLETAVALLPNSYIAQSFLGSLRMRQGRWRDASALLERAAAIEPGDNVNMASLVRTYAALRDREAAERAIRRTLATDPDMPEPKISSAYLLLRFDADLAGFVAAMEPLFDQHPTNEFAAYTLNFGYHAQGRFKEAASILEPFPGVIRDVPGLREMQIGWAYREMGDKTSANRWFEMSLLQSNELDSIQMRERSAFRRVMRAYALGGLGRAAEAAETLREALATAPRSEDESVWANIALYGSALLAQIGDIPGALGLVREMLDPPTRFLPNDIWFHWAAAPLRANPEFRELMARHDVDVTRDPRAEYTAQHATASQSD